MSLKKPPAKNKLRSGATDLFLATVIGPLQAALDPSRVSRLKDFERFIASACDKALKHEATDSKKELTVNLRNIFDGFDQDETQARVARIQKALHLLQSPQAPQAAPANPAPKSDPKKPSTTAPQQKGLSVPFQYVKGVGPKIAELFAKRTVNTVGDAFYYLPRSYEDRRKITALKDVIPGERFTVIVTIMEVAPFGRYRKAGLEALVTDDTGMLTVKWFRTFPGMKDKYRPGRNVLMSGKIEQFKHQLEIHHPDIEVLPDEIDMDSLLTKLSKAGILPIYPLTEGINQQRVRRIMANLLESYGEVLREVLPPEWLQRMQMTPLPIAMANLHRPPEDADLEQLAERKSPDHRRLIFEDFFYLQLALAKRNLNQTKKTGYSFEIEGPRSLRLSEILPFELTAAQHRVIEEIMQDLHTPSPMHRLLQGDVGSGKTIVAFAAALPVIDSGFQAALMAPTEILAEQHYQGLRQLAEQSGIRIGLLTGGAKSIERRKMLVELAEGKIDLAIGTHALIQKGVEFKKLGLAIVDEQHRFGVEQRLTLGKKKTQQDLPPDLLVMSATPIPRTLVLAVYGDLEVSTIDQLPPGRKPIETLLLRDEESGKLQHMIAAEIKAGRQAFVVCPLVEESEKLALADAISTRDRFAQIFPDYRIGLMHGRLKSVQKEKVMAEYAAGEIDLLVATTVIEVGIDIPNATMMVVEHAERFGLSQLHQLRGRIGRGEAAGKCVLIVHPTASEDAYRRLSVMVSTNDGFKIAEADLEIRGPGEITGTRQSGVPTFRVANLIRDREILEQAREIAKETITRDPQLELPEHVQIAKVMHRQWKDRLKFLFSG
jgi:ATP-dependent DNA helicase RecG